MSRGPNLPWDDTREGRAAKVLAATLFAEHNLHNQDELAKTFFSIIPPHVISPFLNGRVPEPNQIRGRGDTLSRGGRTDDVKKYETEFYQDKPTWPLSQQWIAESKQFITSKELTEAVAPYDPHPGREPKAKRKTEQDRSKETETNDNNYHDLTSPPLNTNDDDWRKWPLFYIIASLGANTTLFGKAEPHTLKKRIADHNQKARGHRYEYQIYFLFATPNALELESTVKQRFNVKLEQIEGPADDVVRTAFKTFADTGWPSRVVPRSEWPK